MSLLKSLLGSKFVIVTVRMFTDRDRPKEYFILKKDAEKFVRSFVELHHHPGINPHNGGKTVPLYSLEIHELGWRGPYWWTTPGLKENGDPNGVQFLEKGNCTFRFESPEAEKERLAYESSPD